MNATWSTQLGKITPYKGTTEVDRVKLLFRQVAKSIRDPLARTLFAEATQGVPERDEQAEIEAVFYFVKSHLRYTGDVRDLDTFQVLVRTWALGIADCDDFTGAYCSILISGGYRCGAMILAQDGKSYNHVLEVTEVPRNDVTDANRRIIALDGTVPEAYPGWLPVGHDKMLPKIFWYQEASY